MKEYPITKLREIGETIHTLLHKVYDGKEPDHKAYKHSYYDFGFAYFDKRLDDIEKQVSHIDSVLYQLACDMKALHVDKIRKKEKRKPTEWQTFFGKKIKEGHSHQEISQIWKLKKSEGTQDG